MTPAPPMTTAVGRLRLIKAVHTLAWAFFVACIAAIPLPGGVWYLK